ncbi:MAG: DUF3311 domain-containing protein [Planctomycetota bacterium]
MKILVWSLIALLVVLHQDVWFWDSDDLIFGFMPITLLYHAGISVAASGLWLLAVNVAWPADEDLMDEPVPASERPIPKEKTNWRHAGGDDMQGAPA